MGDMLATCISPQSRNHQVGVQLGKGRSIDEIIEEMVMVAEGVKSAPTVMKLAERAKCRNADSARCQRGDRRTQITHAGFFMALCDQRAGIRSRRTWLSLDFQV